jgi:hypothetical protein
MIAANARPALPPNLIGELHNMKSTRRHELQTNQLADKLGHWIEGARPYGTTILLIAGGAVLVLFAAYFFTSSKEKSVEASWRSYLLADVATSGTDVVEELNNVTDQFSGSLAGQWAALTAADIQAARGVEKLFTDRAAAETDLNSAKTHYREVIDSKWAASEPLMMHRAQYGLAQVLEAQGELDEASKLYAAVADEVATSLLGKTAKSRKDLLAQTDVKKWYNWFGNQKPAPRDLGPGAGGPNPLGTGTDLNSLPDTPIPDFIKDAKPDAAAEGTAPATTPDATTPPATTPPATTPPAAPPAAPAESSPPTSSDPPASEQPVK